MLPIQFLIIEYVSQNKCDKEKIMNTNFLVNYSKDFKQSLISSLIFGGILKLNGDDVELVDNSELISSDFINIFFTTTNYGNIWEQKRKEELIMNRQDVISSQINHFVKINSMSKDELFKTIVSNIKIFELDIELFNKTIDKMIENDYIKLEDNMVVKLLW